MTRSTIHVSNTMAVSPVKSLASDSAHLPSLVSTRWSYPDSFSRDSRDALSKKLSLELSESLALLAGVRRRPIPQGGLPASSLGNIITSYRQRPQLSHKRADAVSTLE